MLGIDKVRIEEDNNEDSERKECLLKENDEQDILGVERSPRSQWKAMLKKHVIGYSRNREFVSQEIFNLILYTALLYGFSFTATTNTNDSVFYKSTETSYSTFHLDAAFVGDQICNEDVAGFVGPPCYVSFQDSDDGCTALLEEAIQNMPFCRPGSNDTFVNETWRTTGKVILTCTCVDEHTDARNDRTQNVRRRIAASVEFEEHFPGPLTSSNVNNVAYTIRTPQPSISQQTVLTMSPFTTANDAKVVSDAFANGGTISLQVAVDAALLDESLAVGIAHFPTISTTSWSAGALMNFPLYLTIAIVYSVSGITTQLVEEGTKGKDKSIVCRLVCLFLSLSLSLCVCV